MEKEGLIRAVEDLQEEVIIGTLVTDRHNQIVI